MDANADQLLKDRGLRVTKIRSALLDALSQYEGARTYSELHNELQDFDRTTLYRNLITLKESGIIHIALETGNDTYYALCPSTCSSDHHSHDHVHFRCDQCQTVTCLDEPVRTQWSLPHYVVREVEITLKGLCPTCRDAQS